MQNYLVTSVSPFLSVYIYIYVCVCVCVHVYVSIYRVWDRAEGRVAPSIAVYPSADDGTPAQKGP